MTVYTTNTTNKISRFVILITSLLGAVNAVAFAEESAIIEKSEKSEKTSSAQLVSLASSIMWQPIDKEMRYIYPAGIPAVLKASQTRRSFRIEQYFTNQLSANRLAVHVTGPWVQSDVNQFRKRGQSTYSNPLVSYTVPECAPSDSEQGHLFRCIVDFSVSAAVGSGTIEIAISQSTDEGESVNPNSVFWIVIPEVNDAGAASLPTDYSHGSTAIAEDRTRDAATLSPADTDEIRKYVVRISVDGSVMLGTGFLTRQISALAPLFSSTSGTSATPKFPSNQLYVVTAAHLFPTAAFMGDLIAERHDSLSTHAGGALNFTVLVNGQLIPFSAELIARNVASDVAILRVFSNREADYIKAIGGPEYGMERIEGLSIGKKIAGGENYTIFGYPVSKSGALVVRNAFLPSYGIHTEDTSNVGAIGKLRLEPVDTSKISLAEPGMSGGPIVDKNGKVVGIATERPNDSNLLIGVDFTSVLPTHAFGFGSQACHLDFNPFSRIIEFSSTTSSTCDYGNFGSSYSFPKLPGRWVLQEVFGVSDPADPANQRETKKKSERTTHYDLTNGHAIINGHAVINGHTTINGHAVINGQSIEVSRDSIDSVNDELGKRGYQLNVDSFNLLETRGVRILAVGSKNPEMTKLLGKVVLATRNKPEKTNTFAPIYSIRAFTQWLHEHDSNVVGKLVCTDEIRLGGNTKACRL